MMGVCFDCLVTIDGVGNRQGCLVRVREGMRIETQQGKREAGRVSGRETSQGATTLSSSAPGRRASRPPR